MKKLFTFVAAAMVSMATMAEVHAPVVIDFTQNPNGLSAYQQQNIGKPVKACFFFLKRKHQFYNGFLKQHQFNRHTVKRAFGMFKKSLNAIYKNVG